MKTAHKGNSQKGLSTILLIVLIVVAILVLVIVLPVAKVFLGIGSTPQQNSTPTQSTEKKVGYENFDKLETDSSVFYYPKGYIKKDPPSDWNPKASYYANPNSKAVSPEDIGVFPSGKSDTKLDAPTYDYCVKKGEELRKKTDDDIKVEVAQGGIAKGKGAGCKVTIKSPIGHGINDSGVNILKVLWNVGQDNLYIVRASYYANASSSEAEKLNLAIDQFTLK